MLSNCYSRFFYFYCYFSHIGFKVSVGEMCLLWYNFFDFFICNLNICQHRRIRAYHNS